MQDQDIARQADSMAAEARRLYCIRHSLAHVLAQAILEFRPGTRLGFGPPIEHGFYYDFDLPEPIVVEDLPKIEKRMRQILRSRETFVREDLGSGDAIARIGGMGQPFKDEAARDLESKGVGTISFYTSGSFIDMCEGPHVGSTEEIPADAFKLDSIAGAYWRGDEKNKMLTRIYGLSFLTKEELEDYVARRKLAIERDHRKLGRELDIFHIDDEVGKVRNAREQLPLRFDGLTQVGSFIGQRMAAPRFAEAFDQRRAERVEIDDLDVEIHTIERQQNLWEALQVRGRIARVDADSHTLTALPIVAQRRMDQRRQQADGEVVDAVEAGILEHVERGTFTGTRTAADDDQLHLNGQSRLRCFRSRVFSLCLMICRSTLSISASIAA